MAAMAMATAVSDEQWAEAKRLFDAEVAKMNVSTLTKAKYDGILDLLLEWDSLTPLERRERSGGNNIYWSKKYVVAPGTDDEDGRLLLRDGNKIVVHQEMLFQAIKDVHLS